MDLEESAGQQGGPLNPQALSVGDLARVLTASGRKVVTAEMVRKCLADGAATNADGTISLVKFAAFLAREVTIGRTD